MSLAFIFMALWPQKMAFAAEWNGVFYRNLLKDELASESIRGLPDKFGCKDCDCLHQYHIGAKATLVELDLRDGDVALMTVYLYLINGTKLKMDQFSGLLIPLANNEFQIHWSKRQEGDDCVWAGSGCQITKWGLPVDKDERKGSRVVAISERFRYKEKTLVPLGIDKGQSEYVWFNRKFSLEEPNLFIGLPAKQIDNSIATAGNYRVGDRMGRSTLFAITTQTDSKEVVLHWAEIAVVRGDPAYAAKGDFSVATTKQILDYAKHMAALGQFSCRTICSAEGKGVNLALGNHELNTCYERSEDKAVLLLRHEVISKRSLNHGKRD